LALELYLKSLCYCLDGQRRTGHHLHRLFGEIADPSLRSEIGQEFLDATGREVAPFLAEIDDAFVFWRYVHEQLDQGLNISLDTEHMDALARLLSDALNARLAAQT
jgi:hypothetical protein